MSIVSQSCNVTCSKDAKFGERNLTFDVKVGNGITLADLAKDVAALGIHESQVCAKFWAQYVTDVQNVARPFLRTCVSMTDGKDAEGKPLAGAESSAKSAVAKHIEAMKKPVGESREMSPATAKRKAAEKQADAINRLGADIKSGDAKAKLVQAAIVGSKAGLGCLQVVSLEYITKGADAAIAMAKAS